MIATTRCELTSRAAQTGYNWRTNGVQTEIKRIQATTFGVQNKARNDTFDIKLVQTEYKRLQAEYKNLRVTTSLVQIRSNRRRGNGACRSDPVWPTGAQYNARSTFARFCTFVLLPSPNSIIFAKRGESTNGYKRITRNLRETTSRAVQNEYKRSTREYKGVQTEYNNQRELTSRAAQTGYKRSTNGVQTEYKRIQANTNGVQNKVRNDTLDITN